MPKISVEEAGNKLSQLSAFQEAVSDISGIDTTTLVERYVKAKRAKEKAEEEEERLGEQIKFVCKTLQLKKLHGPNAIAIIDHHRKTEGTIPAGHHPMLKKKLGISYEKVVKTKISIESMEEYPELFGTLEIVPSHTAIRIVHRP